MLIASRLTKENSILVTPIPIDKGDPNYKFTCIGVFLKLRHLFKNIRIYFVSQSAFQLQGSSKEKLEYQ